MVDLELVAPADRCEERGHGGLVEILDALAIRADEMVVVLGIAGDVCRHVAIALEPARHPVLDLGLERAVDGRPAEGRVRPLDALVELLGAERAFRGGEGLGDDHPLAREPAAAGGDPLTDWSWHLPSIRVNDAI